MARQIKRYGSRKLYDSVESQYVSMQEVAAMIRDGQQIEVVDNKTGEDVTVQVLTQVISEQGRRGSTFPSGLLHDLIRVGEGALQAGEDAVTSGVKQIQQGVEGFVQKATGRLKQPSPMQDEMASLRARLEALEQSLGRLGEEPTDDRTDSPSSD
jgi:polyhydroxyalkanoate synthesis repressor PhaR